VTDGAAGEWYFAYGCNMAEDVLRRRQVSYLAKEVGELRGFRLRFNEPGIPPFEPVFANIEEFVDGRVYGVLYRLERRDFDALTRIESSNYAVRILDVHRMSDDCIRASVYVSIDTTDGGRPSRRYRNLLVAGARENGLPDSYVAWLLAQPCTGGLLHAYAGPLFHRGYDFLRRRGWVRHEEIRRRWSSWKRFISR
jgi:sulfite reductase (NADPH) flavoprotein alpha-component